MKKHLTDLRIPGKSWASSDSYFVPPVVIPIAIVLTVLLWAVVHGPMG